MANSSTVTISLRMNNQGVVTGLQQVGQQAQRTGQAVNTAGTQGAAGISRLDQTLATVTNAFRVAQAALAAFAIYKLTQDVVAATLRLQAFSSAMTAITGSGALAKESMEFVAQTANKLGLNLVALESSYKNLAGSAMGTSLAGEQTEKIFTAVAKASAVLGLSADQTQGSLYAIGQMMSKGTVQAEELKGQLAERLPGAFQLAAKAMGVTTAQLQKMLEQGEVMATDMLPKLADELEKRFGGAAEKAGETARASFERFGNAVEDLKRALGESGLVEYLAKMADIATEVMDSVSFLLKPGRMGDFADIAAQETRVRELIELQKIETEQIQANNKARQEMLDKVPAWIKATGVLKTDAKLSATTSTQYDEERKDLERNIETLRLKIETEDLAAKKAKQHQEVATQAAATSEKAGKAQIEADKLAKKSASEVTSAAQKAATEAQRLAEQAAKDHERVLQQFSDDLMKATKSDADYQQAQLDKQYQEYAKHVADKSALNEWYAAEARKIEEDRLQDSEKALEDYFGEIDDLDRDLTNKARQEAERRAKDLEDALEDQRQAYEDFVQDVEYGTANFLEEWMQGGFSSALDSLKSEFSSLLADLAAKAIAEPIIVPVVQAIGGTLGTSAANTLGIPTAGTSSTGFSLSNLSSVYSAISGGLETGVYNALTGGILNSVGSGLFGATAWGGAAGAELGWGATAAATTGMGTSGIAGAIAAAAPWAALAAIAVPLIMDIFSSDPEPFLRVQTTSTSQELSDPNYRWGAGEGKSPSGYDYNLTMQDTGSEAATQLGAAVKKMLDAQFTAIEEQLDVSVNDAIRSAQDKAGQYGAGFFSKIDLRDYEDNIEGALNALSEDLFADIRDELVVQLTGAQGSLFDADFFDSIAVEGETAVDTFLRFGKVVESTDDFMAEFTGQTEVYGESAYQAFKNITTISAVMDQLTTASKNFTDNSAVTTLEEIDAAYQGLIETLKAANATVADLTRAENYRLQELGAAITGLTATSVSSALWESIQNAESATTFVQSLQDQVRTGVAQATVNAFSESIYSAFLAPINSAIGSMVASIVSGGMTTGAALSASMSTIKESLDAAVALMNDEDFIALITTFQTEIQKFLPQPQESTSSNSSAQQNAEQLAEMMQTIRDAIADSSLSDYAQELAEISRNTEKNIATATELGATEQDLADIRAAGTIKISETTTKWVEDVAEYTRSVSSISDVLSDTISSLASAVRNYQSFVDASTETGSEGELLAAAINEALRPLVTEFKGLFVDVYELGQTDIESATDAIVNQVNGLVGSIQYLADKGVLGLEQLDGFIDGLYSVGQKLVNAKLLTIYRSALADLGSVQAEIAGLSDEYRLMQISNRYGSDLSTSEAQRTAVSNFSTMSYNDVLKWSTDNNVELSTIFEDMLYLNNIVNEVSDAFESLSDTLSDYRRGLVVSDASFLDPEKKTALAKRDFLDLVQQSMSTDPAVAQEAMAALPNAADKLLDLSRKSNTSMLAYNTDMSLVLSSLKQAEDYASEYVDTTDDVSDAQDKTLKELQKGHLQAISDSLVLVDKDITNLFQDPELKAFFSEFSTIFGDDIIGSLNGNIDSLVDTVDKFTLAQFWETLQEMVDSGLAFSPEAMEELRGIWSNVSFTWDSRGTVEFWAKTAADFQGTFENAMILLDFVKTESGGWNTPATVSFIQGFNRWEELSVENKLAALGFLLDTSDGAYIGNAALAFIAKLSDAGLPWESVRQTMIDYGFESTFVDYTIKAVYDNTQATEFRTWAEFAAAMKLTGTSEVVSKQVAAYFSGTGITIAQVEAIMTSWGASSALTAAVTANMNMNIVSNTLLSETTFKDFSKAFLSISSIWGNPGIPNPTNPQGYYSIIDGLILVYNAIMSSAGAAVTFPSSMTVTNTYFATINSTLTVIKQTFDALTSSSGWLASIYNKIGTGGSVTFPSSMAVSGTVSVSQLQSGTLFNALDSNDTYLSAISTTLASMKVTEETSKDYLYYIRMNSKYLNSGLKYPSFAAGGYHEGGLRLVGERGPELEVTGSSYIHSNAATRDLLGSDNIVAAIYSLAKRLDQNNEEIKFISGKIKKWDRQRSAEMAEVVA